MLTTFCAVPALFAMPAAVLVIPVPLAVPVLTSPALTELVMFELVLATPA